MNILTTTAAAAVATTTLDPVALPHLTEADVALFVSGMMFGFVGHDDKALITKCLTGTGTLAKSLNLAIADLHGASITSLTKGVHELVDVFYNLPTNLSTCNRTI